MDDRNMERIFAVSALEFPAPYDIMGSGLIPEIGEEYRFEGQKTELYCQSLTFRMHGKKLKKRPWWLPEWFVRCFRIALFEPGGWWLVTARYVHLQERE